MLLKKFFPFNHLAADKPAIQLFYFKYKFIYHEKNIDFNFCPDIFTGLRPC